MLKILTLTIRLFTCKSNFMNRMLLQIFNHNDKTNLQLVGCFVFLSYFVLVESREKHRQMKKDLPSTGLIPTTAQAVPGPRQEPETTWDPRTEATTAASKGTC